MKTIAERAKVFCEKNICVDCGDRKDCDRKCLGTCIPTYDAFEWLIQFGKSEHAELTRWHDPKEKLPEPHKRVLVKLLWNHSTLVYAGKFSPLRGWTLCLTDAPIPANIIGWKEIHE